jgi:hypothetical protein
MSLKDHPFAVEAFFETSVVLTYALPVERLQPLLPACLKPDSFKDQWGFIAIALVKTKNLRPKGFPAFSGKDFILAGFRVFVRYESKAGKKLRGLYILKSETNKKLMSRAGNFFTRYNYDFTDISWEKTDAKQCIASENSGFNIAINTEGEAELPPGSPFSDWKEARKFAGPLPFTFTWLEKENKLLIVEGVRENWQPLPVQVLHADIPFLREIGFGDAILANAFMIENIPYWWKKGRKETWRA